MVGGDVAGWRVIRFVSLPSCYLVSISFWHHCTVSRMSERCPLGPGYQVMQSKGSTTAIWGGSWIHRLQSCCCASYPPPVMGSRLLPDTFIPYCIFWVCQLICGKPWNQDYVYHPCPSPVLPTYAFQYTHLQIHWCMDPTGALMSRETFVRLYTTNLLWI